MSFAYGFGLPHWHALSGGAFNPLSLFQGGVQGAWYDPSDPTTLFSDRAGTTPCGTPGGGSVVPVGLMLDKSQNGVGTNGAKRVNLLLRSQEFTNVTWTATALTPTSAPSVADPNGGAATFLMTEDTSNSYHRIYQVITTTTGAAQIFSVYLKDNGARYFNLATYAGASSYAGAIFDLTTLTATVAASGAGYAASAGSVTSVGNGWYRCQFTATVNDASQTINLGLSNTTAIGSFGLPAVYVGTSRSLYATFVDLRLASEASTLPLYQRIDANWYSTMAGNHAIAANDTTARPELRARVNLLTFSEQFGNAAWNTASATKLSTTETDPNGGSTAALIQISSGGELYQDIPFTAGLGGTFAVYVRKPPTSGATAIRLTTNNTAGWNTGLSTKVTLTSDWQRVPLTGALISSGSTVRVDITCRDATSAIDTDCIGNVLVAFADLRPTNVGTAMPVYQRISDANTYDAVGFPRYLVANGTSSAMSTPGNVNLSGTDKVTVFAGVRKLSTGAGSIVELSATAANPGTFNLFANGIAVNDYFFGLSGTNLLYGNNTGFAPPVSNVLTEQLNQAGATDAQRVSVRSNGTALALTYAGSIGTPGNFGSYPLFIGSRNNSSLFFNGNIYSLIVVGSAVSAGQISATEQWVAGKVGITI